MYTWVVPKLRDKFDLDTLGFLLQKTHDINFDDDVRRSTVGRCIKTFIVVMSYKILY